jgi:hypothetical protein
MNKQLRTDIEKDVRDIANIIRPQLGRLPVLDADSGEKKDFKQLVKTVTMSGTLQDFDIDSRYAFDDYENVHFGLTVYDHTALKAMMLSRTKFRIEAATAVANLTIKVYITGQ